MKIKSKIRTHWKAHRWYIVVSALLVVANISTVAFYVARDGRYGQKLESARGIIWMVSSCYVEALKMGVISGPDHKASLMVDSFILINLNKAFVKLDSIEMGKPKK